MGLHASSERLWMSSLFQLWRLDNILQPGQVQDGFDGIFIPSIAYTTGDLDIHDLAIDRDGQVVFVNTMFELLATITPSGYSFEPLWKPPFISKLAAEDRCHLNELAMSPTRRRYRVRRRRVRRSDITDGWRDRRRDGGVLIDVASEEVDVVQGMSMPHSPRWHNGRLWIFESGTGYFGSVDLDECRFEPLTFCPGYLRGLAFVDHFAIVGLSKPRNQNSRACRWTRIWSAAMPRRAAASWSSTCRVVISSTGSSSKATWSRCTTSGSCPRFTGRARLAS